MRMMGRGARLLTVTVLVVVAMAAVGVVAGKCSGDPRTSCSDAGSNVSMCKDAAHTGCSWSPEERVCSGSPTDCEVLASKGAVACEQMPGCQWSEPQDVWVGIAIFVGVIVVLILVLFIAKVVYQRYIMSRPAEPTMDDSSAFKKFTAFRRKDKNDYYESSSSDDGYVPPAKNDLSAAAPVVKELRTVKISDDDSANPDPVVAYAETASSAATVVSDVPDAANDSNDPAAIL